MKKFFKISLVMFSLILVLSSTPTIEATQATLSDNFNDNRLDLVKWLSFEDGGPTITEVNNRLEITIPADSADQFSFIAEIVSACVLTGDYDIQVDYDLLEWPANNGVRMGISTSSPDEFASVGRTSWGANDPSVDFNPDVPEIYIGEPNRNIISTNDLFGKLRLTRVGNISSSFYYDPAIENWQIITSSPYTTATVHLYLFAFSHFIPLPFIAFGDQEVRIAFDNLIVEGKKICKDRFNPHNPPLF
jgi:hypothetical protein